MAYQTTSIYREKVYNEDARHKLKILFNGIEYPNIDNVCEKLTINSRIIPNGNTNFALDNFISKKATLILHNVALTDIVDPVEIQIGTLTNSDSLGDTYEYVPIGIFNIQDIPTTDKDKTTITLRDNAVKFDFPYNAEPLIEGNGGSVSKMQIFQDICSQAGVETNVTSFLKDYEQVGTYDNSKSGRQYIAYLAEQAGAIAIINRYGNLDFVYLDNLEEQELPLQYVEKYEDGTGFEISKVVYESGIIKYEKGEETKDTLYLDASNPYINDKEIEKEAQGNEVIVDIGESNNGEGYDLLHLEKDGKCEQDGTPTPESPVEIKTLPSIKNLFDKNNYNVFNGYIDSGGRIVSGSNDRSIWIECKPNTDYSFYFKQIALSTSTNTDNIQVGIYNSKPVAQLTGTRVWSKTRNLATENFPYGWTFNSGNNSYILIKIAQVQRSDFLKSLESLIIVEGKIIDGYRPYGNYIKIKTKGKNLLDIEDIPPITNVTNTDGIITINGSFPSTNWSFSNQLILKANKTYTLSLTNTYADAGNSAFVLKNNDTDKFVVKFTDGSASYTPTEDVVVNQLRLYNHNNRTFDNYSFSIQLEQGSRTTYEPYKERTTLIDVSKPNLFDEEYDNITTSITYKSINVGDGTFTLTTITPLNTANNANLFFLTGNVSSGASTSTNGVYLNRPITISSTNGYVTIAYRNDRGVDPTNYKTQLFKSENPTPYYEICSVGDTKNELVVENGRAKLIRRIGKAILDGNENWAYYSSGQYFYNTSILANYPRSDVKKAIAFKSNYFIDTEQTSISTTQDNIIILVNQPDRASEIDLKMTSLGTSTSDLKTWLSTHNTIVYYILATPEEIDLGDYSVGTLSGYNRIYFDETLETNMKIRYVSSEEQIDAIYDILNGFKINSFKTGKILGNPAIDPYDIISVHDKSKNLFDKNNYNVLDAYFNTGSINKITSNSSTKTIYISCKSNTTYTLSKILGTRFFVGYTTTLPTTNIEVYNRTGSNTATQLTITTGNDAQYIVAFIRGGQDTLTLDEILDTIQIEEGSVATNYVPFKDETYKTLATNTLTYNGKLIQTFDTQIKIGDKQSNVSLMSEPTFQKYARTNIDNINNNIELVVAEQNETTERLSQVIQTVESIQNTFQVTGGNNLIKDSQGLLGDDVWTKQDGGTYLLGYDASLIGKTIATARIGISNGKMTSTSDNINGLVVGLQYTLSYKVSNEANTTTKVKLTGNNVAYEKTYSEEVEFEEETFSFIAETSTYTLEIESTTTMNGFGYIYDLMLNKGDAISWEPASGEIVGTVLKMSQLGMQIYCTGSDIATLMTAQGFQVRRYSNNTLYEVVTEFTSTGLKTKKAETTELIISDYEWKQISYQYKDTLVLYKKESD